jgi:hypothetical protein
VIYHRKLLGPDWDGAALTGTRDVPNHIWVELAKAAHLKTEGGRKALECWNDAPSLFKRRRVLRLVRKLRQRHEKDWLRSLAEADAAERALVDLELDMRLGVGAGTVTVAK